jgi:Flp pilus assembly protein TadD
MNEAVKREGTAVPTALLAGDRHKAQRTTLHSMAGTPASARSNPRALKDANKFIGEGQTAFGSGNMVLAELRAKKALEAVPEYPPALQLLRQCKQNTDGGGPEHEAVLRRILRQDPNDLQVTCELCYVLFSRGETEECEQLARSAIRLAPTNPRLHSVLGLLLSQSNRAAAGEFHLRRVIELEGETIIVVGNLANCLRMQGKFDESEACYRKVTALEPKNADFWEGWSRLEEERANIPRAWELLAEAEKVSEDKASLSLFRATLLGRDGKNAEAVEELTRGREGEKRLPAIPLLERGRLYDKMDRFDEAWADFLEGNRLIREVQHKRYADKYAKELVADLTRFFMRTRMKLIPRAERDESAPQPIFIVGYPRSGTTMVEQTLTAHPLITAGDELVFINDLTRIGPRWLGSPNRYPGCLTDLWMGDNQHVPNQFRDYYLKRSQELDLFQDGAKFFTDKMPLNETHMGLIHILFPHSPIIHVRRHPLDILTSNFSNFLTHGFNQAFDVKTIAQHYALVDGLVHHYKEQLDLNYLEVRYENLVADQEKYVRQMLDFIGVEFDPRCLSFHKNQRIARTASYAQVTEKLYDKSVFRYRHYRKYLDEAVAILRPTLTRLGYATE